LVPSTPGGGSPSIIGTRQGSGVRQIGREGGAAAGRPAAWAQSYSYWEMNRSVARWNTDEITVRNQRPNDIRIKESKEKRNTCI
jgi:hypothetical protein